MYFSEFPRIYYDFPNYTGDDTFLQVLTDITANVRVRKEIMENVTLYDEYDIKEGETPEIIAEKIYGNPEYHWIIMLANQRYDYLSDFPMSSLELDQHVKETYGVDHIYDIHHYERDGVYEEAVATIKVPASIFSMLKVNDFIMSLPVANARIESLIPPEPAVNYGYAVVRMDFGRFADGMLCSVKGVRFDEEVGDTLYTSIVNFNVPTNGFELNEQYVPITNYEYEIIENEKKRRIKIISPRLVEQILKEYREIMG